MGDFNDLRLIFNSVLNFIIYNKNKNKFFQTHFADEHPIEDVLLTGTTVTSNRNDWTITVNKL